MINTLLELFELIVPRGLLGGSKPRTNTVTKAIWHHANGTMATPCAKTQHHNVDIINEAHKQRWPGFTSQKYRNAMGELFTIGYHQVIDFNNNIVVRTRDFAEEGAHCIGMNRSSIGTLMIGNYDGCSGEYVPPEKEHLIYEAWKNIKAFAPHLTLIDNVPHRKYATKSCFGDSLPDDYVQQVILRQMPHVDVIIDAEEEKRVASLQKALIELLQRYIALLTQRMTGKRLSAREI